MGFSRSNEEIQYALSVLGDWMQALRNDRKLARQFVIFVEWRLGIPASKFRNRLYHIKRGRLPTTGIALAFVEFFTRPASAGCDEAAGQPQSAPTEAITEIQPNTETTNITFEPK